MTYSVYQNDFLSSSIYLDFKKNNPGFGTLRVRAYYAREALPVSGIKVLIRTNYNDNTILFFEGETDESGLIDRITLPTPRKDPNNLEIPKEIIYQVQVSYPPEKLETTYFVPMYDGVCSVQNIIVNPATMEVGVVEWP